MERAMQPQDRPEDIVYGHCWCGCGGETKIADRNRTARHWVKGEPMRFLHGHGATRPLEERYVVIDDGCWEWKSPLFNSGYGAVTIFAKTRLAHRWVYEQIVGPIPQGLTLDHLCMNPRCVNPAHLEPVTLAENVRRAWAYRRSLSSP